MGKWFSRLAQSIYLLFLPTLILYQGNAFAQSAGRINPDPNSPGAGFGDGSSNSGSSLPPGLEDFLKLNRQLPKAVCDDQLISRPPSLSVLNSVDPRSQTSGEFWIAMPLSEKRLIEFLMDDSVAFVGMPKAAQDWELARSKISGRKGVVGARSVLRTGLVEMKKGISLQVCTSLLDPKTSSEFLRKNEAWFGRSLPKPPRKVPKGKVLFKLRDVEGRFGQIAGEQVIAGWIEPYEVVEARLEGRIYRRLAHPVTNQLQMVLIVNKNEVPFGYFFPSGTKPLLDWATLESQSKSPANLNKKIDAYRYGIESRAYERAGKNAAKVQSIGKLQDFYKKLISAYQLYPESEQFSRYKSKSAQKARGEVRKTLNKAFFENVANARINEAQVGFAVFQPDSRLHAIYQEFSEELAKK